MNRIFLSWNIISISLITLAILLVVILILVVIFRKHINFPREINSHSNALKISKNMNDFHLSINSNKNQLYFYNILFKNKFSKIKYSLIPSLFVSCATIYLVTNIIDVKNASEIVIQNSDFAIVKNKKRISKHEFYNFNWYKDIKKYLVKNFSKDFEVKFITPILDENINIVNNADSNTVIPLYEIEKFINKNSSCESFNQESYYKISKKLLNINVFKNKKSIKQVKNVRI